MSGFARSKSKCIGSSVDVARFPFIWSCSTFPYLQCTRGTHGLFPLRFRHPCGPLLISALPVAMYVCCVFKTSLFVRVVYKNCLT